MGHPYLSIVRTSSGIFVLFFGLLFCSHLNYWGRVLRETECITSFNFTGPHDVLSWTPTGKSPVEKSLLIYMIMCVFASMY